MPETATFLGHTLSLQSVATDVVWAAWDDVKRLELNRELLVGTGHWGRVFRARDLRGDRAVALKVLLPEFGQNETTMEHFGRALKIVLPIREPRALDQVHYLGLLRRPHRDSRPATSRKSPRKRQDQKPKA